MAGHSMRFPITLACLLLLSIPVLSACSESGSASSGPYAAFDGIWESDNGEFLDRTTYDFAKGIISFVSVKKNGQGHRAGFTFIFTPELKNGALRISSKMTLGDMTEELELKADGSMIKTRDIPTTQFHRAFQYTRPKKENDALFAKVSPAYEKLGGEWVKADGKPGLRIDTVTGKVTLLEASRDLAETLEKDLIPAISYFETVDSQQNRCNGEFTFADHQQNMVEVGGKGRREYVETQPIYITVKPCASPATVAIFKGGFGSGSYGVLTKR